LGGGTGYFGIKVRSLFSGEKQLQSDGDQQFTGLQLSGIKRFSFSGEQTTTGPKP